MTEDVLICTRLVSTIEWLRRQGISGEVTGDITSRDQVRGKHVYGNCPLWAAAEAASYTAIEVPNALHLPPRVRGRVLSADELEHYGARLVRYVIRREPLPAGLAHLEFDAFQEEASSEASQAH